MSRCSVRLVVLVALLVWPSSRVFAAPILIDFEGLDDSVTVGSQLPGLTFSNATILTAELTLNEDELPPKSGAKVAFDDGGAIRIDFATPIDSVGGYFNYYVPITLEAFGSTGNSLGSIASLYSVNAVGSGDAGSSPNEFLQLAFAGIAYMTITGDPAGGSLTLDDLTYSRVQQVEPVPEPGTLALVLLGACGLVRMRLSRNNQSV